MTHLLLLKKRKYSKVYYCKNRKRKPETLVLYSKSEINYQYYIIIHSFHSLSWFSFHKKHDNPSFLRSTLVEKSYRIFLLCRIVRREQRTVNRFRPKDLTIGFSVQKKKRKTNYLVICKKRGISNHTIHLFVRVQEKKR